MALTKTILKASAQEVIVKWTGSGSDTLTLASLIATNQTVTGTAGAVITGVKTSVDGAGICTIVRNGVEVLHVHDNYTFQSEDFLHAVLGEESTSNILVNLSALGTLIIKVKKMQGYSAL
jgi:hypothetical protein